MSGRTVRGWVFGAGLATGFAAVFVAAAPTWVAAQSSTDASLDPTGGSHARATLLLARVTVAAGGRVRAALELTMAPGWHTYWRNPGDAGGATRLVWTLPAGWTSGPLGWPTPERLVAGPASAPLVSYGYSGTVRLPVTLRAPATLAVGDTLTLRGTAHWIACADVCIPGSAVVERTVRVVARDAADALDPGVPLAAAAAVQRAFVRIPAPLAPSWAVHVRRSGAALGLTLVPPTVTAIFPRAIALYAADPGMVDYGAVQPLARVHDTLHLRVTLARTAAPARLRGLLVPSGAWAAAGAAGAVWIDVPVERTPTVGAPPNGSASVAPARGGDLTVLRALGGSPARNAAPQSDPRPNIAPPLSARVQFTPRRPIAPSIATPHSIMAAQGEPDGAAPTARSRTVAVLLALAGGVLLNVMPCVLPVVALKVLGFVALGGGDARRARRHGFAFAAGVLAAFASLGGLLGALRAAGRPLGWGFQLQTPAVVATLALLFVALALNLLGAYEVGAGLTRLAAHDPVAPDPTALDPTAADSARRVPSLAASAGSGALAVAVATPCTAPFMGAALGWALVRPPGDALLVMVALGVGMAAPYAVLAAWPAALRRLPRPGAWMVTVRQLLAFPLLATALWLAWVYGRQTGVDGMGRLLAAALLVGAAAWGYGRFAGPGASRRVRSAARLGTTGLAALACAAAIAGGAPGRDDAFGPARRPGNDTTATALTASTLAADGTTWYAWSPSRVDALRRAGRPVFVDFTADWCVSCKVNERLTLADADVRRGLAARGVVLLRADWTRGDAAISRALAAHGRDGVPLYLVYPADGATPPTVLPALLTPAGVLRALTTPPADRTPMAAR